MTTQGIIFIDIVCLVLLGVLGQMVRRRRLNPGYGALWILAVLATIALVSVPPALSLVTVAVGALFPVSALSLLAFFFIFVVLVFFSTVLSRLARQFEGLAHALAITRKELLEEIRSPRDEQPSQSDSAPGPDR